MKTIDIKISDIFNRFNPRKSKTDVKELAASIKAVGILEPLIVRKDKEGYELIAGSRRLAAAELAGLETVPCSVLRLSDNETRESENMGGEG